MDQQIQTRINSIEIPVDTRYLTPEVFQSQLNFGKGMLETDNTIINTLLYPALITLYNHESWQLE